MGILKQLLEHTIVLESSSIKKFSSIEKAFDYYSDPPKGERFDDEFKITGGTVYFKLKEVLKTQYKKDVIKVYNAIKSNLPGVQKKAAEKMWDMDCGLSVDELAHEMKCYSVGIGVVSINGKTLVCLDYNLELPEYYGEYNCSVGVCPMGKYNPDITIVYMENKK